MYRYLESGEPLKHYLLNIFTSLLARYTQYPSTTVTMNKAAASRTTSARDVRTRVEGMAVVATVVGVVIGEVVGVGPVRMVEVVKVVGIGRMVEVVKAVGLGRMVEVGNVVGLVEVLVTMVEIVVGERMAELVGLVEGTKPVVILVGEEVGVEVIYCSLLHGEQIKGMMSYSYVFYVEAF